MVRTVAFQGERGAYSEEAVFQRYGPVPVLPCRTLPEVFDAVEAGVATEGLVPIENSLAGSINESYDLLLQRSLTISGETILRVRHCLLALPGSKLGELKRVYSHPQALAQCGDFVQKHGLEAVAVYDTAGGARMLVDVQSKQACAIASRRAAELYGLEILAEGIETNAHNYTRFYVITKEPPPPPAPGRRSKTVLVFSTAHRPGTLYWCLGAFAYRNINLLKLESRPIHGRPWEYLFYADIEGHSSESHVKEALKDLETKTVMVRVLGSFEASS
ncbi:MAG: prephenate dehydratase [Thermoleophilia bacterium]|nr:prephenate dehydratase [Thermoleophilia bacterium]